MYPRSKSESVPYGTVTERHEGSYNNGAWTTYYLDTNVSLGNFYQAFDGFGIENFHSRRRKGELLPFTPFRQYEIDSVRGTGTYGPDQRTNNWRYRTLENWTFATAKPWYLTTVDLDNLANQYDTGPWVQKAAAKVYSQGFDALTFLAELNKTLAMFKGLVSRWASLLSQLKIGQSWLEYRYGWRTLWYDILDVTQALINLEESRKRFSERVGYKTTYSVAADSHYTSTILEFDSRLLDIIEVSVRGSVVADIDPPKFQFNPALTGWEIIRFSFIIDWFIQIGTWLESLSFQAITTQYVAAGGILIKCTRTSWVDGAFWKAGVTGSLPAHQVQSSIGKLSVRIPQHVSSLPFARINIDAPKVADLWAIFSKGALGSLSGSLRL